MELRLHGRGGQGSVTCAKILAGVFARLGKSVQAFGDYAGERSGAPVRAFVRVSDGPVENRNKVYRPDHLLVLDPSLLGPELVDGLAPGGLLLVNSPEAPETFVTRFGDFRIATVDAAAIARRNDIGSRSVVIVNTTLAGAFMRAMDLPLSALEATYEEDGLIRDYPAAREAYEAVRFTGTPGSAPASALPAPRPRAAGPKAPVALIPVGAPVIALVEHREGPAPKTRTGSWSSQHPRYVRAPAPCSLACPAGNDVVGFVQALARQGEAAAAAVLARTTPLPGVCGRVCPAPCMGACNRGGFDGAVNVRGLERWVADHAPPVRPDIRPAPEPRRFAIVGGGPAGLAAAWTLARWGHRSTLFEAGPAAGGLLRTGIPQYRLPREVLDGELAAIARVGVDLRCGSPLDASGLALLVRESDALILAMGLQKTGGLGIPGQGLAGIQDGIEFLADLASGRSMSLRGHVAVIGGGNTAMDCARAALRLGASEVTVVYRRGRAEMPAIPGEIDEAVEEGVRLLFLRQPAAFEGADRVRSILLAEVELGEADAGGRRRPVVRDRTAPLAVDHVLMALGQSADRSLLPSDWELRDDRAWSRNQALPVFLAGDFGTSAGTVAHAIGDGRRAAIAALEALGIQEQEPEVREQGPLPPRIRTGAFARTPPAAGLVEPAFARRRDFREVDHGFLDPSEASRCFSCGSCTVCDTCLQVCPEGVIHRNGSGYSIDLDYCKGCGICVAECPRGAMEMSG